MQSRGETNLCARLSLRLFGIFEAAINGVPMPPTRTRKEVWLLCLLALRQGKSVERMWLAGVLWPDCEESRSLANLRRSLNDLRRCLGDASDLLTAPTPRSLSLATEGVEIDVVRFDAGICANDPGSLLRAVTLYNGSLLVECVEDWIFVERASREQSYLAALLTLSTQAKDNKEWANAARFARLMVAVDPLLETAHCALIEALANDGNLSAATQAYRDLRVRLREELNAEPDSTTKNLYEHVRAEARKRAALPASTRQPLHNAPVQGSVQPASDLTHLPIPHTRLIGREQVFEETMELLNVSRLVTLTGAGGVGKTRLAIELARRASGQYADGVAFIDLAPHSDEKQVALAMAAVLGVREAGNVPLISSLVATLQPRNMLLLLDNCEHLLDACSRCVECLLSNCGGVHLLTTSRQPLGVTGEVVWRVPSLPFPLEAPSVPVGARSKQDAAELLEFASVQLFLERVQQANPEFRIKPFNLGAISEICRRLDGIPLALELAAGRVRALSLEQIATRLQDRFRLLGGGNRAALPRQQTLSALIQWSYQILEPAEQQLFAAVSVFTGSWTISAARAIAWGPADNSTCTTDSSEWELQDHLASLVDKSLIVFEPGETEGRFRLLESVREFGRDLLKVTGNAEAYFQRHADFYAALVQETEPELLGPNQALVLDMLDREHDNIRAALSYGLSNPNHLNVALKITAWAWRYWMQRGHWREGRDAIAAVLAESGTIEPLENRARSLHGAGVLAYRMGDLDHAQQCLDEAHEIWASIGDARGMAAALASIGHVAAARGQMPEARVHYLKAVELNRSIGCNSGVAYCMMGLGNVCVSLRELPKAKEWFETALPMFRECGDLGGELLLLGNMGTYSLMTAEWQNAVDYAEASLKLCRDLLRPEAEGLYLPILGIACDQLGNTARARQCYLQALRASLRLGDKRTLAATLATIAAHHLNVKEYEMAAKLYSCSVIAYARINMLEAPQEKVWREEAMARMREALGSVTYERCWEDGKRLSVEDTARQLIDQEY